MLFFREKSVSVLLDLSNRFDRHRLVRHVGVIARCVNRTLGNPVQDFHAVGHLAEDAVTVALRCSPLKFRASLSEMLKKNWQVALSSSSPRRSMAMVPRVFFRPLSASLRIGVEGHRCGSLVFQIGRIDPAEHDLYGLFEHLVEDRGIVVSVGRIVTKIVDRQRRLFGIQPHGNLARGGVHGENWMPEIRFRFGCFGGGIGLRVGLFSAGTGKGSGWRGRIAGLLTAREGPRREGKRTMRGPISVGVALLCLLAGGTNSCERSRGGIQRRRTCVAQGGRTRRLCMRS